jgi:hypothetical protein
MPEETRGQWEGCPRRRPRISTVQETAADYKPLFGHENEDIGFENAYFWNLNPE